MLTACSCEHNFDGAPIPDEFAGYERVSLESHISGVQPMTGIVLWTTHDEKKTDKIQLEFSYMLYNDVCKGKDEFDWTPMDRLLDEISRRGHQAVVRFRYTYVGEECAVPDYIKALADYEETVGDSEGERTCFPDWRCEELQRFHMEFHRRFAERYDNDPRLAFLETGFGLWGEYHIYDGPFIPGQTFPSKEFQRDFIKGMGEWFHDTTWSISIDSADSTYGPFADYPELLGETFGNFDDSFMCEDHDGYNYSSWKYFGTERYKKAPLGGEFSYYSRYDQQHCLDSKGMYGRVFENEVARFHMTFIIGNDQPGHQSWDRIKEASMAMGYSFTIKDYLMKEGEGAAVLIANEGVAPIYRDAYVAVNGIRGDFNLRNLMPGEEKWVRVGDPKIRKSSKPEIACDHLVPGQRIEYKASF